MAKSLPPEGGYLFPRIAKALRLRANVRAVDMAKRLGVSDSAIAQFENATTAITEDTLRAYADALGCRFEDAIREGIALV